MVVPFGFSVGDFIAISKLIYKIGLELKKNSKFAPDYQLLLIELESLDRALKVLQCIKPAQHELKRLDAIRALATTCRRPLEDFLAKIEKFEIHLGSPKSKRASLLGLTRRMQWSMEYEDEVKSLRARLAPNVATITILLVTQTLDTVSNSELDHVQVAQALRRNFSSQRKTLKDVRKTASHLLLTQRRLQTRVQYLTNVVSDQHEDLSTLKSKADELLEDSVAHRLQLRDQAAVLEDIRENSLIANCRTEELQILATSIRQDTTEIRAAIPSLLSRALDLMSTVAAGVSKIQEISSLISRMIHLTTQFTNEMREIMGKLLLAFWEIQKQLARLERFIPRQIDLPIVRFRDAFNEIRAFPYDLCKQWQTFQKLVVLAFTNRQGLHRVNTGQYLVTSVRVGRELNPTFWSNAIEPGDELVMTMILDDIEAEEGFCPYKSCGASTMDTAPWRGGKICPKCFRFAAMSQKNKSPSRRHEDHERVDSYDDSYSPESDLESISSDFEDCEEPEEPEENAAPAYGPQPQFLESEDIELYHSIQVVQALLSDADMNDDKSDQRVRETSTLNNPELADSDISESHIQIFVKDLGGKTLTIRTNSSDTIEVVKDTISKRNGMPKEEQRLLFSGKQLKDNRTLSDYDIQKDNTLQLALNLKSIMGGGMSIFIKPIHGNPFELFVQNNMKILEIKNRIELFKGILVQSQTLSIFGQILEDGARIHDYNIRAHSAVTLDIIPKATNTQGKAWYIPRPLLY